MTISLNEPINSIQTSIFCITRPTLPDSMSSREWKC